MLASPARSPSLVFSAGTLRLHSEHLQNLHSYNTETVQGDLEEGKSSHYSLTTSPASGYKQLVFLQLPEIFNFKNPEQAKLLYYTKLYIMT